MSAPERVVIGNAELYHGDCRDVLPLLPHFDLVLTDWTEQAPPRQTWVAARYGIAEPDLIVKTCKHGCCVQDPGFGSLVLPRYWRLATEAEVHSVGGQWQPLNS